MSNASELLKYLFCPSIPPSASPRPENVPLVELMSKHWKFLLGRSIFSATLVTVELCVNHYDQQGYHLATLVSDECRK